MRNVVYAFAADHSLASLPDFAAALASHFRGLGPVEPPPSACTSIRGSA